MITEYKIADKDKEIQLEIIRSERKSVGIEISKDERAVIRIPYWLKDTELKDIINKRKAWIIDKCQGVKEAEEAKTSTGAIAPDKLTNEELEQIKAKFLEKVNHYSKVMGVSVNKITIRNQKTRWGSCSSKGNLNFNYQLYYMPEELMDYVVIHELSHRRYMDHSEKFWSEVERYCPDYEKRRNSLKKYSLV